ncbi:hypothetical protein HKX48_005059 [Thoreauomyces humboldtii]|nr:hypothetical protein HKX48_005059 [Thoreauomyces humboldtii]
MSSPNGNPMRDVCLLDLPLELLTSIIVRLPVLTPLSQTSRRLRRITRESPTRRSWARRLLRPYDGDWNKIMADVCLWGRPSQGGIAASATRRGGLAAPGVLGACVTVLPPSADQWPAVFEAACVWNDVEAVAAGVRFWSVAKEGEESTVHALHGVRFAALNGAADVVSLLTGTGNHVHPTDVDLRDWSRQLEGETMDSLARGQVLTDKRSRQRRSALSTILDALEPATRPSAAEKLLCAVIGDVEAMRLCMAAAGVPLTVTSRRETFVAVTTFLRSLPLQVETGNDPIQLAIQSCIVLQDDPEAIKNLIVLGKHLIRADAVIHLLHHALAPPTLPGIIPMLLDILTPSDVQSSLKDLLELVLLTGRQDLMDLILARGVDLSSPASGPSVRWTLLNGVIHNSRAEPEHVATVRKGFEIIAGAGADVGRDGPTALAYACELGDPWTVEFLLRNGLDISGNIGGVALVVAKRSGVMSSEVVDILTRAISSPT